jgi:UDP-glucose 4-epimerase
MEYKVTKKYILVTGGAGYIGSHLCVELLEAGYNIVALDNFSNSSLTALQRVRKLTGVDFPICECDIRSRKKLREIFSSYPIVSVLHLAGLKSVGESVDRPIDYYDNNVAGTVCLLEVMSEYKCKSIVFSSSATVYGEPKTIPVKESFPLSAVNPYGRSKLMIEDVLRDLYVSDNLWSIALLRYFNPVGAHVSGFIGEDPRGTPNNLMPYIAQVALGKLEKLSVFGDDYPTVDGTGVRDFIHVVDLAKGHIKALEALRCSNDILTLNLGTGDGISVLELVKTFEKVSGKKVPYEIKDKRVGDVASCYADVSLAKELIGWSSTLNVENMCRDVYNWQVNNPNGYEG